MRKHPKLPRESLPAGWLEEPRACGARGIYVKCPVFQGCCVRHDADYDLAVIKNEDVDEFAEALLEADDRFISCMARRAKRAKWWKKPALWTKYLVFGLAVTIWRERTVKGVRKAGGVTNYFYKDKQINCSHE